MYQKLLHLYLMHFVSVLSLLESVWQWSHWIKPLIIAVQDPLSHFPSRLYLLAIIHNMLQIGRIVILLIFCLVLLSFVFVSSSIYQSPQFDLHMSTDDALMM